MRILHASDLHLQHDWYDWVSSNCVDYDLLVIAGDLQDAFSGTSMQEQASAISQWLMSLAAPTCVVDGNHDFRTARGTATRVSTDLYADGGWLKMLGGKGKIVGVPGDVIEFRGVTIACNGWLQVPKLDGPVDVLITHAPPAGCSCATGAEGRDVGDPALWPSVSNARPKWILAGHVHTPERLCCRSPGIASTTTILVPGFDEGCEVPAHWILDTAFETATHSSGVAGCSSRAGRAQLDKLSDEISAAGLYDASSRYTGQPRKKAGAKVNAKPR